MTKKLVVKMILSVALIMGSILMTPVEVSGATHACTHAVATLAK